VASAKAPSYDVSGRTVFITGAARGIGKAAAERLHAKGANIALVGLEPQRLQENAAQLGERAIAIEADVTDLAALEHAVEQTVARFGAIDVAIANAGIAYSGSLATAPVEQVERTLAVNLLGVWRTDRAVIDQITKQRGYLLNIASLSALSHSAMMGPYTTAKSGVDALSDALRMESAPFGAAVGCAYFGFLDTDLVRGGFAEPSAQAIKGSLPGFIGNPAPLSKAIDAIERGIERRSPRVWAPRWVGSMLYLRGVLQPLTERLASKDTTDLVEAIRLAQESNRADGEGSPLGVAAKVLD
jgi:NAD(P)-dependent dehydrogenase (short-subunit alcohol dehydrogenase family)